MKDNDDDVENFDMIFDFDENTPTSLKNSIIYQIHNSFDDRDSFISENEYINILQQEIKKLKYDIVLKDIYHKGLIKKYKKHSENWVGFLTSSVAPYKDPYEYLC